MARGGSDLLFGRRPVIAPKERRQPCDLDTARRSVAQELWQVERWVRKSDAAAAGQIAPLLWVPDWPDDGAGAAARLGLGIFVGTGWSGGFGIFEIDLRCYLSGERGAYFRPSGSDEAITYCRTLGQAARELRAQAEAQEDWETALPDDLENVIEERLGHFEALVADRARRSS